MSDYSWASVIFDDGHREDRPKEFFEDYENVTLEVNKKYFVFWSPDADDTPQSVLTKQKKILREDEMRKKNRVDPQVGFYRATVLKVAKSQSELNEGATASKSTPVFREKKRSETMRKSSLKRSDNPTEVLVESPRAGVSEERNEIKELPPISKNEKNNYIELDDSEDSDNGVLCIEYLELKLKCSELREKVVLTESALKMLQDKYDRLQRRQEVMFEENKELRKLNMQLQKEVIDKISSLRHTSSTMKPITKKRRMSSSPEYSPPAKQRFEKQYAKSSCSSEPSPPSDSDSQDTSMSAEVKPDVQAVNNTERRNGESKMTLNVGDLEDEETADVLISHPDGSEFENALTKGQVANCLKSLEPGKRDDQKFVKRLADLLWTREQLSERSIGAVGAQHVKNGTIQRKECSPRKKKYIEYLLTYRMNEEEPHPTKEERHNRKGKINEYLSSKMSTVRRSLPKA